MEIDRNGLEVLSEPECLRLLGQVHLGRLALTQGALPTILPVNFALLDGDVIIRANAGSKLAAAMKQQVVCFEADTADPLYHEGWSVTVTGRASLVTDPDELDRLHDLPLRPWARRIGEQYIRVKSEIVTGRRLRQAAVTA